MRHERLRLYLAVVAVVGAVPGVVHLGSDALATRLVAGCGLARLAAYATCALAFAVAMRRGWVVRVTRTFAVWSVLVMVHLFIVGGATRNLTVPWALFVLIPAVQAAWASAGLTSSTGRGGQDVT